MGREVVGNARQIGNYRLEWNDEDDDSDQDFILSNAMAIPFGEIFSSIRIIKRSGKSP